MVTSGCFSGGSLWSEGLQRRPEDHNTYTARGSMGFMKGDPMLLPLLQTALIFCIKTLAVFHLNIIKVSQ